MRISGRTLKKANALTQEVATLRKGIEDYQHLKKSISEYLELANMLKDDFDEETFNDLVSEYASLSKLYDELEVKSLLNGEYDYNNCYLEIHPGAGGTEACDWASMLLRMYTMFCDKMGFNHEILSIQSGEEAGIKSVMLLVKGAYAYGYLKSEIGVHRLVRISPFDSNSRRHTSFAAVNVTPEFEEIKNVQIKDEDIRVDVYRSSGCGGQGVNTTDQQLE